MPSCNLVHQHTFDELQFHLTQLEVWRELALRPTRHDCHPDDHILLDQPIDDIALLSQCCLKARAAMNAHLPPAEQARDDDLSPQQSRIPGAGLGLFYQPSIVGGPLSGSEGGAVLSSGDTLCYMTGHLHNFHSAKSVTDRSYLLLLHGDNFVDSGPLLHIKARYINDPLNENYVNCKFVPEQGRAAVVAIRDIEIGEELFVSYGPGYWSQHTTPGNVLI